MWVSTWQKNVFHIHAVDKNKKNDLSGKICNKHMVKSDHEASAFYSDHWNGSMWFLSLLGKRAYQSGYTVQLAASQFVKPYVKTNKNDKVDAEAICEAINWPNMRFVSVKTSEQQDIQSMNRV